MSLVLKDKRNIFSKPYRSLMSDLFGNDPFFSSDVLRGVEWPAVNVIENENDYKIEVAAPGFKKDDLEVNVSNGMLTLSANTEDRKEESDENFMRKEFSSSSFKRSFTLPENVDENKIQAKYNEGVLSLTLEKTEGPPQENTRSINVE